MVDFVSGVIVHKSNITILAGRHIMPVNLTGSSGHRAIHFSNLVKVADSDYDVKKKLTNERPVYTVID